MHAHQDILAEAGLATRALMDRQQILARHRYVIARPLELIGLGCELNHADRLVYSRGFNLENPDPTPIGINCRLCERPNCSQRAEPPSSWPLLVDETLHGISPFGFVAEQP